MTTSPASSEYSGADWLALQGHTPSEFGALVADILGQVFRGIYHIERYVRNVSWDDTRLIIVSLGRDLATYDGEELTRLVILCHDHCVRLEIEAHTFQNIKLIFHPRNRAGGVWERHPTIEQAITYTRDVTRRAEK